MNRNCRFWPQVLSLRGTVILRIWIPIIFIAVYSTLVVFVYKYFKLYDNKEMPKDLNIFHMLGITVGLLLVFRTNTAYDRFWEGRKLWSDMICQIRIITRTVWVFVDDKKDASVVVGKISLLNMLVGFATATKHYLREEYSYDEHGVVDFVGHLPHLLTPSSNQPLIEQEALLMEPEDVVLKHIRSKMSKEYKRSTKKLETPEPTQKKRKSMPYAHATTDPLTVTSNIPLEISFYISAYFVECKNQGLIDSPTCRILDNALAYMVRSLTGMERIRRTPIPLAYAVHLKQITWIVLIILPFQWIHELNWATIPAVVLTSFALLGILEMGREIENPFGYDYNDLNLDDFCNVIHKEVLSITSQPMPKPDSFIYCDNNFPITTDPSITATQLAKLSYEEVCMILSEGKNYKFFHSSSQTSKNKSRSVIDHIAESVSKTKEAV